MDTTNYLYHWLNLLDKPAFCVKNGVIIASNSAAVHRMVQIGMDIFELVVHHRHEYETFKDGCLYLEITVAGTVYNTSVTRTPEYDVFVIHQDTEESNLKILALAAQHLKIPLSNIMTITDLLLSSLDKEDSAIQQQVSQINHSLFQLLRIICNMSDASQYRNAAFTNMQTVELNALFGEIMEKIQAIASGQNVTIAYTGLNSPFYGLADSEKIERAAYNLLSNAIKFSQKGSCIQVKLTNTETTLSFSVCNVEEEVNNDLIYWKRYNREPSIEDARNGLGLGMSLVSSIAIAHGGTVFVDHPSSNQTRITMTISITSGDGTTVRSPTLHIGDYAGGRDKGLLEFCDILPPESYYEIN